MGNLYFNIYDEDLSDVSNSGMNLKCTYFKSPEICKTAITENPHAVLYAPNKVPYWVQAILLDPSLLGREPAHLQVDIFYRILKYILCKDSKYDDMSEDEFKHLSRTITHLKLSEMLQEYENKSKNMICRFESNPSPSHEDCMDLLNISGMLLRVIMLKGIAISRELALKAVSTTGAALQLLDQQDEEICLAAVSNDPAALQYVNNKTIKVCRRAVSSAGYVIKYVNIQTPGLCKLAVEQDIYSLRYIKHQTEEICSYAIEKNPLLLSLCNPQTDSLCKLAITKDPDSLEYIIDQKDDLCLLAIKLDACCLQLVKNQTKQLCDTALEVNPASAIYAKHPSLGHYLAIAEYYPHLLAEIDIEEPYIWFKILQSFPHSMEYIPKHIYSVVSKAVNCNLTDEEAKKYLMYHEPTTHTSLF